MLKNNISVGMLNACLRLKMYTEDHVCFESEGEEGVGTWITICKMCIRDRFIVVTPNGRSTENCAREGSDYNSFYVFGKELRSDLIPYMEAHYSTLSLIHI